MTEDPIGEEIPELLDQLEGSLNAPNVEALHAVHTQRQAARKRTLGAAGVFVALLALAGGVLAVNRDNTTSTVTADGLVEPAGVEAATDSSDDQGAVADDSSPFEIESLSSDLRRILASQTWRVGTVTGDPGGFTPQLGTVRYVDGPNPGHGTLTYTNGCEGSAYTIEWTDITGAGIRVQSQLATIPTDPTVACLEATQQSVLSAGTWMTLTTTSSSTLRMGTTCHPLALCVAAEFLTVELIGTADEVALPGEPTRLPVGPAGIVRVDENCLNVTSVQVGDDRWYATTSIPEEWHAETTVDVIVAAIGEEGDGWLATDSRGLSAQFSNTGEEATARSCQRWEHFPPIPSTTTIQPPQTSTPQDLAGPPSFSPSADLTLSGQWNITRMWNGDVPIDVTEFGGSIGVLGRSLNGNDGCNSHGNGSFYATADGQVQLQSGNTTLMGCIDTELLDLFGAGTFGADRWGRTQDGTLVLTNGDVVVEFELAEAMPAGSLQDISASLDTIWTGDEVSEYDNFTTENSPATLTFVSNNNGTYAAVLDVTDCGDFVFNATFEDTTEGPITFAPDPDVAAPCQPTGAASLALEALARADYFAAAYDGVLLWDGPTPLATFADE